MGKTSLQYNGSEQIRPLCPFSRRKKNALMPNQRTSRKFSLLNSSKQVENQPALICALNSIFRNKFIISSLLRDKRFTDKKWQQFCCPKIGLVSTRPKSRSSSIKGAEQNPFFPLSPIVCYKHKQQKTRAWFVGKTLFLCRTLWNLLMNLFIFSSFLQHFPLDAKVGMMRKGAFSSFKSKGIATLTRHRHKKKTPPTVIISTASPLGALFRIDEAADPHSWAFFSPALHFHT